MAEAAATDGRGRMLLGLARRSLEEAFQPGAGHLWFPSTEGWLADPGATFVTLFGSAGLRGCVGSVIPNRPLAEDVWENARAAAFRDGRFVPLTAPELPAIRIEVSELSSLEPVPCESREEACEALRPGHDGAVVEWQQHRGVFLPQVWEHLPEADRFLGELARKAGLAPEFWAPDLRLFRFTVRKWSERAAAADGG
jgi:AmmeMemoRadiSam system protein A